MTVAGAFCLLVVMLPFGRSVEEDQVAAAITVYRNPDFFRHLSDEFNSHLQDFTSDPPKPYAPREHYESPETAEYDYHDYHKEHYSYPESESQSYPDEKNEHIDVPESEGGGFNTYEGAVKKINGFAEPDAEDKYNHFMLEDDHYKHKYPPNEEPQEEEHEDYKYPGEPKKPNPPGRPNFNVHFDGAPGFNPPRRDIPFPKGPTKKGRGPYGHPRLNDDHYGNYMEEYEDGRRKPEEQQLEEIAEKNMDYQGDYNLERPQQQLHIYHEGQKYPVELDDFRDPEPSPVQETQPIQHPNHQPYGETDYNERIRPHAHTMEEFQPIQQPHPIELVNEIKEPKKGTREYLRYRKTPMSHELEDFRVSSHRHGPRKHHHIRCTRIRHKKPKKYISYQVRPIYSTYKVIPFAVKPVYYTHVRKEIIPIYKRSAKVKIPRALPDDSAYLVNSERDSEFEVKVRNNKKVHHG